MATRVGLVGQRRPLPEQTRENSPHMFWHEKWRDAKCIGVKKVGEAGPGGYIYKMTDAQKLRGTFDRKVDTLPV